MATPRAVEELLARVSTHKGVLGVIVAGTDGSIHKTTLDDAATQQYAALVPRLTAMARNLVRDLDAQNDLEFLRVRSAQREIMVAPRQDFLLMVIQDASGAA